MITCGEGEGNCRNHTKISTIFYAERHLIFLGYDDIIKTRTNVLVFGGKRGWCKMKEVYRQAIYKLIGSIEDERVLKKIYTYVVTVIKKISTF